MELESKRTKTRQSKKKHEVFFCSLACLFSSHHHFLFLSFLFLFFFVVKIYKKATDPLGLSIKGGRDLGMPIVISAIKEAGPVANTRLLYVGDEILEVVSKAALDPLTCPPKPLRRRERESERASER